MNTTNLLLIMQLLDDVYNTNKTNGVYLKYSINSSIEDSDVKSFKITIEKIYKRKFYDGEKNYCLYAEMEYKDGALKDYIREEASKESYYSKIENTANHEVNEHSLQFKISGCIRYFFHKEGETLA